jgi:soluble lytic murein transglycosylase-like protein
LLLALIRQESLYQPDVVSSAEAIGLTQVIPTTADAIAAEIGVENFRYADLRRPRVSLQFGAHYLGGVPKVLAALSWSPYPRNVALVTRGVGGTPRARTPISSSRRSTTPKHALTSNW